MVEMLYMYGRRGVLLILTRKSSMNVSFVLEAQNFRLEVAKKKKIDDDSKKCKRDEIYFSVILPEQFLEKMEVGKTLAVSSRCFLREKISGVLVSPVAAAPCQWLRAYSF
jgi:hypothetical protein